MCPTCLSLQPTNVLSTSAYRKVRTDRKIFIVKRATRFGAVEATVGWKSGQTTGGQGRGKVIARKMSSCRRDVVVVRKVAVALAKMVSMAQTDHMHSTGVWRRRCGGRFMCRGDGD